MPQQITDFQVSLIRLGFLLGNLQTLTEGTDLELFGEFQSRFDLLRNRLDRLPLIVCGTPLAPALRQRIQATIDTLEGKFSVAEDTCENAGFPGCLRGFNYDVTQLVRDVGRTVPDPEQTYFRLGVCLGHSWATTTNEGGESLPPIEHLPDQSGLHWVFFEPEQLQSCLASVGLDLKSFLATDDESERNINLSMAPGWISRWEQTEVGIDRLLCSQGAAPNQEGEDGLGRPHAVEVGEQAELTGANMSEPHPAALNAACSRAEPRLVAPPPCAAASPEASYANPFIFGITHGRDHAEPVRRTLSSDETRQIDLTSTEWNLLLTFCRADEQTVRKSELETCWQQIAKTAAPKGSAISNTIYNLNGKLLALQLEICLVSKKPAGASSWRLCESQPPTDQTRERRE